MLLPENMVRLQIISDKSAVDPIVTKLLKLGMFQPEDPLYPLSNERIEDARRLITAVQDHVSKLKIIMELGGLVIEPLGSIKVVNWIKAAQDVSEEASKLEERYKELLEEIGRLRAEKDLYQQQLKELEPIKSITVELSKLYSLELFDVILAQVSEDKLRLISQIIGDSGFAYYTRFEEGKYTVLIITEKNADIEKKLKETGVRRYELQEGKSPFQLYNEISERINQINTILERTREELAKKVKTEENYIKNVYGKLLTVRDALNIMNKARISEYYLQIEGYLPEKYVKRVQNEMKDLAHVDYIRPRRYGEKEEPPTLVELPKSIKVLESLVEIYGSPSYWEISPIVFLVFTFPILFGLMFPDFGNALVLLLFSIWFYRYGKKRGSENIPKLSIILIYSSIVAMITGLLARDFFGPLPVGGLREILNNGNYSAGPLYNLWPIPASVSEAIKFLLPFGEYSTSVSIENTMIFSVLLGAIALFVSSLLGIIDAIRKKDSEFLFLEKLPLFLLYVVPIFIFMYGITDPANFFIVDQRILGQILNAVLMKSLSENIIGYGIVWWTSFALLYNWVAHAILVKRHDNATWGSAIAMGFIEGGFEGALLLLSNTISFIRVLVFALSHYYILYAFSYMAYLVAPSTTTIGVLLNPIAIVILIIGNLLAIGLEGLVVFIQDLRLHFYEMFSKFYEGRGRKFEPVMAYVSLE
ncbi:V-type ATP synthase subunit I [Saccharolobus islandicus]|uniref:A-type ATP synthase subunit I n=3 Tax=Saccharolobus islandicus TaxID=43080 RepID=C4KHV3_SACI6|nr:V-type ATP synthase subunit I [Sulfolobus islandicus]ACP38318.1 V-type ATPase 116 kDa subunit [Sulfolobus islandicus M.14.25]ACP55563.1 V-type ATPase 116 kDa subunit [Sulfolobus islandicus M.16.27]ACR42167.1 V-type ATPase 116 kDa subunit [Sulfolobus islandicus M.16.4]